MQYLQHISKLPIDSFQIFWLSMPDKFRIYPRMHARQFQIFLGQILTPASREEEKVREVQFLNK